ncbi:DUF1993 domain-containing protein [Oryzifoliimicrobium ureilyticus]|uniref:DUF1993 domain-containing protein n=1 Tax=Oryzifoliimicrobium ureilyticus TaxID=3113724 RepID=UPI00307657A7
MSITLYELTTPVFLKGLHVLSNILKKGEEYADASNIPHETLLNKRLVEDMYPLIGQVQRASDTAKFAAVRLGQVENVPFSDDEATFADLQKRIEKTVSFLQSVPKEAFANREDAEIVRNTSAGPITSSGSQYALQFAIPNFFFHVTTAYDILRHSGVPIGKRDYLG